MRTAAPRCAGPDRQLAPAGADLEQPGSWSHSRLVEQPVDLAPLRLAEDPVGRDRGTVSGGLEQGRGVRHGLVEEQGEELVGQVIVVADVAARAVPCLFVRGRVPADRQPAHLLQRWRHEVADVHGEDGQQAGQVRAVPVAGQVGLAEPDEPAGAKPGEEGGRVVHHHDRRAERPGTEATAAGQPDPDGKPGHRRVEQDAGDLPAYRRSAYRRDVRPPVRVDRLRVACCVLVTEPPGEECVAAAVPAAARACTT